MPNSSRPHEHLAFPVTTKGELDLPGIYSTPLPEVIAVLSQQKSWDQVAENLPDIEKKE